MSKFIDQLKNEIVNIKNKVTMNKASSKDVAKLQTLYNDLWKQKANIYNANTDIMNSNLAAETTKNILLSNQKREINHNNNKIDNLKGDIMSMSRQVHIAENEYRKKSFYIFLLKHIFIFLLLILLVGLLIKNDNITRRAGVIITSMLGSILIVIILLNFYFNRNRNALYFNKRDWSQPDQKHRNESVSVNTCGV
mgnify:CR=1 FL=1